MDASSSSHFINFRPYDHAPHAGLSEKTMYILIS